MIGVALITECNLFTFDCKRFTLTFSGLRLIKQKR